MNFNITMDFLLIQNSEICEKFNQLYIFTSEIRLRVIQNKILFYFETNMKLKHSDDILIKKYY